MDAYNVSPGPVRLNVGGAIFATSLSTLMRFPDSMLGRMFGGDIPTAKDETGAVFIDRDGEMFRHVLNFLRDGDLLLPDSFDDFLRLQREADFFCLDALKEAAAAAAVAASTRRSSGLSTTDSRLAEGHLVDVEGRCAESRLRGSEDFLRQFFVACVGGVVERRCGTSAAPARPLVEPEFLDGAVRVAMFAPKLEEVLRGAGCRLLHASVAVDANDSIVSASKWFVDEAAFEDLKGKFHDLLNDGRA